MLHFCHVYMHTIGYLELVNKAMRFILYYILLYADILLKLKIDEQLMNISISINVSL
jgi:hypothetical protein